MINLIIKGNMFDAFNASHARGIALISAAQLFNDKPNEVVASCADSSIDAVRTWFMASDGPAPYPAGALLFYSNKPDAGAASPDERLAWFNDERAAPARDVDDRRYEHVTCDACGKVWQRIDWGSVAHAYFCDAGKAPPASDEAVLRGLERMGVDKHG
jgi:hypothetical protein